MVGINSITKVNPIVSCEGTQEKNNGNDSFKRMLDFQLSSLRKNNKKVEEPTEETPSQKQFQYELGLIQIMTSNNNEIKKEKENRKK